MNIRVCTGAELLGFGAALRSVYRDAFGAPPWNEGEAEADAFAVRLTGNTRRPGFVAAVAVEEGLVNGFATAWTTPSPFPTDRSYGQAAAALGSERAHAWLCGALEVDELALRPAAQGTGLGARLLDAVTQDCPEGRAWLLTSQRSGRAMSFYRHLGWYQATHPTPDGEGLVLFLGPRHPARDLTVQPL
ncbi:GNAT family N-acetyltransferase [Streptomyces sp. SID2999]|uniref:GNAT family N-acetyltransferase n=1 Tax=Streptomyces sp. SID2999 TaxID=2690258 RepID=UPI001371D354|nr:GNAT family N-acetyltransferase [Streptomyces sp. SID2999]MYZ09293.1 GNAT family N-acetyltransferase [Streptomyces sp. SID2999]